MDEWDAVDAERKDTLALLETLEPSEWDTQSLCTEWKVRDVVAHLVLAATMSGRDAIGLVARHGFRFNRAMARSAVARGAADGVELVEAFRGTIGRRTSPPMTKPADNLVDLVVHAQDMRRPLGRVRQIPEPRLVPCLERLKGFGFPFGAKKRVAGLKLEADDYAWASGEGPLVRGPGEAILMMLAGRAVAVGDLSGEGIATLRSRA